jgi:hypothetical protein
LVAPPGLSQTLDHVPDAKDLWYMPLFIPLTMSSRPPGPDWHSAGALGVVPPSACHPEADPVEEIEFQYRLPSSPTTTETRGRSETRIVKVMLWDNGPFLAVMVTI